MSFRMWMRELLAQGSFPSQYRMAKVFGVSEATITLWMKGEHLPGLNSCVRISRATGKPVGDIVEMVETDSRLRGAAA